MKTNIDPTSKRGAPRKPGKIYRLPIRCADAATYLKILAAHDIDARARILSRAIRKEQK